MKTKYLLITSLIVIVSVFIAAGIYASTNVQNVIELKTGEYAKHKKGIVKFEHRKHQQDYKQKYPKLYKASCGECHHDQDHKPLVNLKENDNVKKCIECHKKPAHIEGKKAKGLSKQQKREYHANALHDNCKGCHKKFKKMTGKKSAPISCKACHPSKK